MADSDDIVKKIEDLKRRHDIVVEQRAKESGKYQIHKEQLEKLTAEIRAAGIDPKNLVQERDKLKAELEQLVQEFESKLVQVETAIAALQTT